MCRQLQRARERAYISQQGRCYYCGFSMWLHVPEELSEPYNVSADAARPLQCTAEHLVARSDGGGHDEANIVAACIHCNQARHRLSPPPRADAHKRGVRLQVRNGSWHRRSLREVGLADEG